MVKNISQKYQEQQVLSASPAMLVAMLYDKAISSLNEAIQAIRDGEIEKRWRCNTRAQDIISHMQLTLNVDEGGQIAANLDQLYTFMLNRLPNVDIENDPKAAREVIGLLNPLAKSWRMLAENPGKQQAAPVRNLKNPSAPAPATRPAAPASDGNEPYERITISA